VERGGYLLYCTCSAFEEENEAQVAWFSQTFDFTVEYSSVFNGMKHGSDTLYAALMQKK
jgi:16S rRNA C967 or C1407 C5-methylase (RsmB/RsmF family)